MAARQAQVIFAAVLAATTVAACTPSGHRVARNVNGSYPDVHGSYPVAPSISGPIIPSAPRAPRTSSPAYDPTVDEVPVLRLDFSDQRAWVAVRAALARPDAEYGIAATLRPIARRDLAGLSTSTIERRIPRRYPRQGHSFLIVVDHRAIRDPRHPVLLVDLNDSDASPSFRALPREIPTIDANLSLGNMDFVEFKNAVDHDGVFRGFP